MSESAISSAMQEPLPLEDTVGVERVSLASRIPRSVSMIGLLVAILATWHFVTSSGIVSPLILPSPARTIADLGFVGNNLVTGGYMLTAFSVTAAEALWGAVALTIGVSLGVLVGETTFGEKAVMPYIVAIDIMPKLAFAPLFVVWLGIGFMSKVALAAFISVFPIVVGTAAGLHAADANARMLFKSIGASPMQAQGHVQMMLRTQLWQQDPQTAADAPRWRVVSGLDVALESSIDPKVISGLSVLGHNAFVETPNATFGFGGAQLVQRIDGGYAAGSDPRKDGHASGF